jgi:hypothetical protein
MAYSTTQPLCEFECLSGPASLYLRHCETHRTLYSSVEYSLQQGRAWVFLLTGIGPADSVTASSPVARSGAHNSHLGVHTSFSPRDPALMTTYMYLV